MCMFVWVCKSAAPLFSPTALCESGVFSPDLETTSTVGRVSGDRLTFVITFYSCL